MKRLEIAGGDILAADCIVREDDRITGYAATGDVLFRFDGISDMTKFVLMDGNSFDSPDATDVEKEEEIKLLKKRLTETEDALTGMMDFILMGGM